MPRNDPGQEIFRELLLTFFKATILARAEKKPLIGNEILVEIRKQGYEANPGTVYPLLKRMEARGWLKQVGDKDNPNKKRKEYSLTPEGRRVLHVVRSHTIKLYEELFGEVNKEEYKRRRNAWLTDLDLPLK